MENRDLIRATLSLIRIFSGVGIKNTFAKATLACNSIYQFHSDKKGIVAAEIRYIYSSGANQYCISEAKCDLRYEVRSGINTIRSIVPRSKALRRLKRAHLKAPNFSKPFC